MVGKEPELNMPFDWKSKKEEYNTRWLIKPCNSSKVEDTRRLSSGLTRPYHLRINYDGDNFGFLASLLIQVFSVHIFTDFDDGKPSEIYGSIRALEGSKPRFCLYQCDLEDSETVGKYGRNLSLIGPEGGAILPSMSTTLKFCLRDRIRGVKVVEGRLEFDPVDEYSYDRLLERVVQGPHGYAVVRYVVFRFACYATVRVIVTKTDHDDKNFDVSDIYGSIVAEYDNARMFCDADEKLNCLETRLFDKPSDKPLRVLLGTPIRLSRNVVVVPAYSSLVIQVNLWDSNGKIPSGSLHFPAIDEDSLSIRSEYACVEVQVKWDHAYLYIHRDRYVDDFNRQESSNKQKETPKYLRVQYYQHPSAIVNTLDMTRIAIGNVKVEVFTVFVGGITRKISALCGAILVDDGSDIFSIYNRDDSCLELLPDNSLASIEVNYRAIENREFRMTLYLRDPVNNLEVSRGFFAWNVHFLELSLDWYNKRLCSVVQGDDGYAAVHYEIFAHAYETLVEVKLFADDHPNIPINLYGTLIGRYSGYDYTTSYEEKYYTSRLFYRTRDMLLEVKTGSVIVLLKSIVVVPHKSSLIIDANLFAFGIDIVEEPIIGIEEFGIDFGGTVSKKIPGTKCRIEVSVKFRLSTGVGPATWTS